MVIHWSKIVKFSSFHRFLLSKVYGNDGWTFIEDGSYRVLIEVMLSEQEESDHEHDHGEKLVHECSAVQGNTESSEAGQCGKMVCGDHDGDESINEFGVLDDKQMESQGTGLDHQTVSTEISCVATVLSSLPFLACFFIVLLCESARFECS